MSAVCTKTVGNDSAAFMTDTAPSSSSETCRDAGRTLHHVPKDTSAKIPEKCIYMYQVIAILLIWFVFDFCFIFACGGLLRRSRAPVSTCPLRREAHGPTLTAVPRTHSRILSLLLLWTRTVHGEGARLSPRAPQRRLLPGEGAVGAGHAAVSSRP